MNFTQRELSRAVGSSPATVSRNARHMGFEQTPYSWADGVAIIAAQILIDERNFPVDLAAAAGWALRDCVEPLLLDDGAQRAVVLSWTADGQPAATIHTEVEAAVRHIERAEAVLIAARPLLERAATLMLALEQERAATKH